MNCSGSASDLLDVSLSQSEKCDNPTNSDIIKMIAEEEREEEEQETSFKEVCPKRGQHKKKAPTVASRISSSNSTCRDVA